MLLTLKNGLLIKCDYVFNVVSFRFVHRPHNEYRVSLRIISLAQLMVQCAQIVKWPALSITIDAEEEKNESQWNIVGFKFFFFILSFCSLQFYRWPCIRWSEFGLSSEQAYLEYFRSFLWHMRDVCTYIYRCIRIRIYIWNWLSVSLANRWHISKY